MKMDGIMPLIIIATIVVIIVKIKKSKNNKLKALKSAYQELLKGSNKKAALEAGRSYYSALRTSNVLTIYDEQAITNDLSTMRDSAVNL